ncbi:hypothetical protein APS56_11565 [Pseudalgibacter alginicilyticus]|uniref:Uncharacterized protein n=1 Tax=Pseudalgibacter alginicilyticus TaxID=1736674 RepID=A0A0P0CSC7_9FLAO|nr:DUF6607 family protein [Pseudalgibacter alginicilyticus]ALJ05723.1 hypothetical protein APS56_11565 [Pseudalgibacter alginicilyticus]
MKQSLSVSLLLMAFVFSVSAQSKKKQDLQAIKNMCGCYEVTFNFAETFNYSKDSLYKASSTKIDKGYEWAQLVEDNKNKISIQHLLQVGSPNNPYIVKHWRQDWLYENTNFYMFNGDNTWNYITKSKAEVKGQWTQKVYQVDDSPRYQGSGTWVHVDGKTYWENITDAPLPRREYTKRSDYNITTRGNRHEITSTGWVHDQDNAKVIREAGRADVILAREKGYNTYVKIPDSKCKAAIDWWNKNKAKWALVRDKWNDVYSRNKNLVLKEKVDNKPLYKFLFDEEEYSTAEKINPIIESFVK